VISPPSYSPGFGDLPGDEPSGEGICAEPPDEGPSGEGMWADPPDEGPAEDPVEPSLGLIKRLLCPQEAYVIVVIRNAVMSNVFILQVFKSF
jgi:hypothetical protein